MTKFQSNIIVFSVIGFVTIMSLIGYFQQKSRDRDVTPKIIAELLVPYSICLNQLDYQKAYNDYTSKYYKTEFSYDEFLKSQNINFDKFGKVLKMPALSGLFVLETAQQKVWIYKGTIGYLCEKGNQRVMVDVINENGKFKINRTYLSYVTFGAIRPTIF